MTICTITNSFYVPDSVHEWIEYLLKRKRKRKEFAASAFEMAPAK